MSKDVIKMWRMAQASVISHAERAKDLQRRRNMAGVRPDPDMVQVEALTRLIRDEETAMAQAALRCKELEAEIRMVSIQELAVEAERVRKAQEKDIEKAKEEAGSPDRAEAPLLEPNPDAGTVAPETRPDVVKSDTPAKEPVCPSN